MLDSTLSCSNTGADSNSSRDSSDEISSASNNNSCHERHKLIVKKTIDKMAQTDVNQGIDDIDREIILLTQKGLPLAPRPYHLLGVMLNISGEEVMSRMQRMLESGKIRRIAAVPNHYILGYRANGMTVWDVPDEKISELGKALGALPFVSHCYHRPRHLPTWSYNLFAMVHGKRKQEVKRHIKEISKLLGEDCRAHDVLYSTRILKKTGLRINPDVKK